MDIQRNELLAALQQIAPFIHKRTLPILSNVLILEDQVQASDIETYVTVHIRIDDYEAPLCVDFHELYSFVKASEFDWVHINKRGEDVIVSSNGTSQKLQSMPYDDFPTSPSIKDMDEIGEGWTGQLKRTLDGIYAASSNDFRFNLNALFFDLKAQKVVTTDGHRLSLRNIDIDRIEGDNFILPKKATLGMVKGLPKNNDMVCGILANLKYIAFHIDNTTWFVHKIEGEYPDYKKVIPENTEAFYHLSTKQTLKALRAMDVRGDNNKSVYFRSYDRHDVIRFATLKTNGSIPGAQSMMESFICFNVSYLIDALSHVPQVNAKIYFEAIQDKQNGPWIIHHNDGLELIMPQKIEKTPQSVLDKLNVEPDQVIEKIEVVHEAPRPEPIVKPILTKNFTKVSPVLSHPAEINPPITITKPDHNGDKQAGLAWGKLVAKLLRKHGRRDVAKFGDRFLAISDTRREMFYVAAAYSVVKSR